MLSNPQNLCTAPQDTEQRHGIRVRLAANDPFRRLLSADWETFHWFADAGERDATLADMCRRHEYSRRGDTPTLRYEPVER